MTEGYQMNELRDHSQPCDHDVDWYWNGTPEQRIYLCNVPTCPGGQEVTIDYEAAGSMLAELRRVHVVMVDADHSARRIVDAALGEDDFSSVAALGRSDG